MKLLDWIIETWSMPKAFISVGTRNKEHDIVLQHIMDNNLAPTYISNSLLVATFGGIRIWIGNYPYHYGSIYNGGRSSRNLPTVRTAYRFHKYMQKFLDQKILDKLKGI